MWEGFVTPIFLSLWEGFVTPNTKYLLKLHPEQKNTFWVLRGVAYGVPSVLPIGVNLRKMDVFFTTRRGFSGGNTSRVVYKMRRKYMLFGLPSGAAFV